MIADFVASRQPQSDTEFFAGCLPDAPPEWSRWVLGARWAVARLGRVHPRFIRSDDRFNDLMRLPGWCERGDAFFDMVGLIRLIEKAVGMSFRDSEVNRLPNSDGYDDLSVREFVSSVAVLCAKKATPHPVSQQTDG